MSSLPGMLQTSYFPDHSDKQGTNGQGKSKGELQA